MRSFQSQFAVQLCGAALVTLTFIALTPVLITHLGLERYGVLLLVLGFIIYAGLAELGLGAATSREIAADEGDARGKIFGVSLLLSTGLAALGGAAFSLLALPQVARVFVDDLQVVGELQRSGGWLFALGAISIVASVPKGVLFGLSSFVRLNVVNLSHSIMSLLGPAVYAVFFGTDLPGLIAVTALAYGLAGLLAFTFCLYSRISPDLRFEKTIARRLLSYGGWATAAAVLHRLTVSLDRILIGAFVGPYAVAIYAIPQSALERSQVLSGALLSVAFPRMARAPDDQRLIEDCYRGILLMAPLFVVGVAILFPAMKIWLGAEFAAKAHTAAIFLAIAVWLDILSRVPYALLQARSALRQETQIAGLIFLPNLCALVLAVQVFGVEGAAAVAILRSGSFLILRLRETSFPSHLKGLMCWNTLALLLASFASILHVRGAEPMVAAGTWMFAAVLVIALNAGYARNLTGSVLRTSQVAR